MKLVKGIFVLSALALVCSCTKLKKEEAKGNDNEVYTTFQVIFTDTSGAEMPKIFMFRDLDGVGGAAPSQFDTIKLSVSKHYYMDILVLNEATSPVDTISNEIKNEGNNHQFFYTINSAYAVYTYLDEDSHSPALPIGLRSLWSVGSSAASDYLRVVLKHYNDGEKNGSAGSGTTDIDITFPIRIE